MASKFSGPRINLLTLKEHGTVAEVRQDVVSITGLTNCMNGQLVRIGESTKGIIVGFDPDYVLVLAVQGQESIKPGDRVITTIDEFKVPVGEQFIGRRLNALAQPKDGKGAIREGRASFSEVFDISELYGGYVSAEAHAGASKSASAQVMTKGEVSVSLTGKGAGVDLGVAIGKFSIKPVK